MLAKEELKNTFLNQKKFKNPDLTITGQERAFVKLKDLKTLWFNTGSLCNIQCQNCYMESSPTNDALAYITKKEVQKYLNEIKKNNLPVNEIAFTGGEPFMNPDILSIIKSALDCDMQVLVLTNAMKPMFNKGIELNGLRNKYNGKITIRVSVDHHTITKHEEIRGMNTWRPMMLGLRWLIDNKFSIAIAGRSCWNETEQEARLGYARLFKDESIPIDALDISKLVIFPEMDSSKDIPEITTSCWEILGVKEEMMMCATSRMVIKKKGEARPAIMPCTLLPYEDEFKLGYDLVNAEKKVKLNHPHCSKFCVIGGGSCSPS